jgi:Anti-sigma-K factor rskA
VSDDDRIFYLIGEPAGPLDPDDLAALDELNLLLADPAAWAAPDAALEDRIVAAITELRPDSVPVTPEPAAPGRGDAAGARKRQQRRRRIVIAVAGVAAAAVIVAAVAVGLAGRGSHPTTYEAALAGTSLAPDASGRASMTQTASGWRIDLHASGLPRLDSGRFYEAWLKNPAGVLVAIGTFNQPQNVILWAGVPPYNFPTMTVTRQQANGNPASSGQKVLVGTAKRA